MQDKSAQAIRYGDIYYHPDTQLLTRAGGENLELRPQSLKVLLYLMENAGRIVIVPVK